MSLVTSGGGGGTTGQARKSSKRVGKKNHLVDPDTVIKKNSHLLAHTWVITSLFEWLLTEYPLSNLKMHSGYENPKTKSQY